MPSDSKKPDEEVELTPQKFVKMVGARSVNVMNVINTTTAGERMEAQYDGLISKKHGRMPGACDPTVVSP